MTRAGGVLKLIVRANARRDQVPLLLDVREEVEQLKVGAGRLRQPAGAFEPKMSGRRTAMSGNASGLTEALAASGIDCR